MCTLATICAAQLSGLLTGTVHRHGPISFFACVEHPHPSILTHIGCLLLQYFYEEQLHRMECLAQEPVLFEDVLCQLHDMIQPEREGSFMLRDLKRCRSLAGTLFNILFNLNKFIAFETRDPFVIRQVRP